NAPREDMAAINAGRQRIVKVMGTTMKRVQTALGEYDTAFRFLQEGKPTAFRDFLLSAPAMFLSIGEAVGVIKHIDSFWRFRFPAGRTPMMEGNEALDIFQDFEVTLSGVAASEDQVQTRLVEHEPTANCRNCLLKAPFKWRSGWRRHCPARSSAREGARRLEPRELEQ